MTSLSTQIQSAISSACQKHFPAAQVPDTLSPSSKPGPHGHYASSAALMMSKAVGHSPRDIALRLADDLRVGLPWVEVDVAGPGFLNITISDARLLEEMSVAAQSAYGYEPDLGDVLLEYGSANPTGPLHVGHARGLVVGSALANVLRAAGHHVTTEYYVNDAGGQIEDLTRSVLFRVREFTGASQQDDRPPYPGFYLKRAAEDLIRTRPDLVSDMDPDLSPTGAFAEFCVEWCLKDIRSDLGALGCEFDAFISELGIPAKFATQVFSGLRVSGHVVDMRLPPLPGKPQGASRPVFLSTAFGDDKDRALTRDDGAPTYFGNDLINHARKVATAPTLITLLGEDHAGYVQRIKAAVSAVSRGQVTLETPLIRMVHLMRNGTPVSMSKRAGTFETVADLLSEVPADVVRMSMLTRNPDSAMTFDLETAVADGPANPVWSVNYAHARLTSVTSKGEADSMVVLTTSDMSSPERQVARLVADWPRLLQTAASAREPHRVAGYARELADAVNAWWSAGNADPSLRILQEDPDSTQRRLRVAVAAKHTLCTALSTLGITPAVRMERPDSTPFLE